MKKALTIVVTLLICLGLCACGDSAASVVQSVAGIPGAAAPAITVTPTPTVTEPVAAPVMEGEAGFTLDASALPADIGGAAAAQAEPAATPEPTPAPTPVPTPIPTPVPTVQAKVYTTKSPTEELVVEGGSAQFVARAENSTGVTWFIASADGSMVVSAAEAPTWFPGLQVSGTNANTLTLSNIPTSLSGWQVQARFEGPGGPVHTARATVWCASVKEAIAYGWIVPGANGGYPQQVPGYNGYTPTYPSYPTYPAYPLYPTYPGYPIS